MRTRLAILPPLLFAVLCLRPVTAQPGNDPPLRVMSFNLRRGVPDDGPNRWRFRRGAAAATIRRLEPHVVGLQETLAYQHRDLRKALPAYSVVMARPTRHLFGALNPVLYDKRRLVVERHGILWLAPPGSGPLDLAWGASWPRACTWIVFRDLHNAWRYLVLNTHFDNVSPRARVESARFLVRKIPELPQLPLILLGDLNEGEGSPPLRALAAGRLRDTFRDRHPSARLAGTYHGFAGGTRGCKIDFVLCSHHWKTEAAAIDRQPSDGCFPSDHHPVWADLSVR